MRLLLIVTVLSIASHNTLSIRMKSTDRGRYANYIINGEKAPEGFAPYHVSIQTISGYHFCSGAIIDERWILTAAHCVFGWHPEQFRVCFGTNDILAPNSTCYYPDKVDIHCNYALNLETSTFSNDIALVHLDSSIQWDAKTQPIKLATDLLHEGSKLVLTGWGLTKVEGNYSQFLLKAEVDYVTHKSCKEMYNGSDAVDVSNVCSLSSQGAGACHGDSGGPLVSNGTLVGIVNWGTPCAVGYPDVYASVFFHHDWIRTTIKNYLHSFESFEIQKIVG